MDSKTHLDYALFQLTPTRTRCDLVVFSGSQKEKLASGLVEPFISHLAYAKEQIPKGGYSISLRPPPSDSSWFTKGTLERFVRFVSTPEVLERFVTLEREISQIESSVQSNELSKNEATEQTEYDADDNVNKSVVVFKPRDEDKGVVGAVQEENSKIHLQRVLETRKAVLRREQAMAYFRAFVAGYEMDCIDDLIAFADTFGASRLRDACIHFTELCYKKHNDGLWMNELAAMQPYAQPELPYLGTSGIVLTTENIQNGGLPSGEVERNSSGDVSESAASPASSDVNQGQMPPTNLHPQYPMSWPNHFPQFMYNFPNQQVPPYQGYPFPGMHPSHYQGNMQWPPNREAYGDGIKESSNRRNRNSSSRKKEKSRNEKMSQTSEEDEHTEPSESPSEGELDTYMQHDQKHSSKEQLQKKRNGKKSSRMVVIRNINYITQRKDGEKDDESGDSSLDEDEFINGDALKQRVEDAVGSLDKHKSTTRHHKKRGGNKTANRSNDADDQNLGNDSSENISEGAQTNENWGAFQNLLLKADDSSPKIETQHALDVRDEYFTIQSSGLEPTYSSSHSVVLESEQGTKKRMAATDSFMVTERDSGNDYHTQLENFEGEGLSTSMKKRDYTDEELLFSQRNNDQGRNFQDTFPESNTEASLAKIQRGEDWFIINQSEKSGSANTRDSSIFDADNALTSGGNYVHTDKSNKNVLVDDSFMIQDRSFTDDHSDSQWRTDLSMVSGFTVEPQHESDVPDPSGDKCDMSASYEPEDLYMVLDRDSGVEPAAAWTGEVDYGMDISIAESRKQQPVVALDDCIADDPPNGTGSAGKNKPDSEKKQLGKDARSKPLRGSLGKSKTEIISRSRKPSTLSRVTMQKTKFETEEETRKRMEELVNERQKRIAERSAARGSGTSKKGPVEIKKATTAVKDDKRTIRSATQDAKKLSSNKPGVANSTVNRITSSTVSPKPTQSKKTTAKVSGEMAARLSPKTAGDENKKSKMDSVKSSKQLNRSPSPLSDVKDKEQASSSESKPKLEASVPQQVHPMVNSGTSEDKVLDEQLSMITTIKQESIDDIGTSVDKSCASGQIGIEESPLPVSQHPTKLVTSALENETPYLASSVLYNENKEAHSIKANAVSTEPASNASQEVPKKALDSSDANLGATDERIQASNEILEEESTPDWVQHTPPSTVDHNLDQSHSRKKWSSDESTPAAKGLKKLLMFGRKKQVAV